MLIVEKSIIKKKLITKIINIDKNETCSLCLNNFDKNKSIIIPKCGHILHLECYNKLTNSSCVSNKLCPSCKTLFIEEEKTTPTPRMRPMPMHSINPPTPRVPVRLHSTNRPTIRPTPPPRPTPAPSPGPYRASTLFSRRTTRASRSIYPPPSISTHPFSN